MLAGIFWQHFNRPWNRLDERHELPEFLAREVRFVAAVLFAQCFGLLHQWISETQLVGARGGDEFFERGELRLPAKFSEPPAGQIPRSSRANCLKITAELAAHLLGEAAYMAEANRRFVQAIDQPIAE